MGEHLRWRTSLAPVVWEEGNQRGERGMILFGGAFCVVAPASVKPQSPGRVGEASGSLGLCEHKATRSREEWGGGPETGVLQAHKLGEDVNVERREGGRDKARVSLRVLC